MYLAELYKKLGEILESKEVSEFAPIWFTDSEGELVSVENLEIDSDGDIILTIWNEDGLYKNKRMV